MLTVGVMMNSRKLTHASEKEVRRMKIVLKDPEALKRILYKKAIHKEALRKLQKFHPLILTKSLMEIGLQVGK